MVLSRIVARRRIEPARAVARPLRHIAGHAAAVILMAIAPALRRPSPANAGDGQWNQKAERKRMAARMIWAGTNIMSQVTVVWDRSAVTGFTFAGSPLGSKWRPIDFLGQGFSTRAVSITLWKWLLLGRRTLLLRVGRRCGTGFGRSLVTSASDPDLPTRN